jgi:hypothetical protein
VVRAYGTAPDQNMRMVVSPVAVGRRCVNAPIDCRAISLVQILGVVLNQSLALARVELRWKCYNELYGKAAVDSLFEVLRAAPQLLSRSSPSGQPG